MNSANLRHGISWSLRSKRLLLAMAAAGMLSACGGGEDGAAASSESRMSGRVVDMNGAPISNVQVRLENRLTDEDYTVVTKADGSFGVDVNPGVYDVLYDDIDQLNYTSLHHTAVDLRRDQTATVRLESGRLVAANVLYGSAVDAVGAPARNKKLLVIPTVLRAPALASDLVMQPPFWIRTDDQGNYSTTLGQALQDYEMDIFVMADDSPEFDVSPSDENHAFDSDDSRKKYRQDFSDYLSRHALELVDVDKPDGAMDLRIVIGSAVRNIRGATGMPSMIAADAQALQNQQGESAQMASLGGVLKRMAQHVRQGVSDLVPAVHAGALSKLFRFESVDDDYRGFSKEGVLTGGRIDAVLKGKFINFKSLIDAESQSKKMDPEFFEKTSIYIRIQTWKDLVERWRGTYRLNFETNRSGMYKFTDRTDDTYSLRIYYPGNRNGHRIFYFSKDPDIIKITYKLSD